MTDIILVPEGDEIKPEDINKAIINLQKQLDKAIQDITVLSSIIGQGTVNGVNKKLRWKALTGTTTGDDAINHGINLPFALPARAMVYDGSSYWRFDDEGAGYVYLLYFGTTQVRLLTTGGYVGQPYRIIIFYYE